MRLALGHVRYLPATAAKRFGRQVSQMPHEKVTYRQWCTIVLMARRFRRQLPEDLVPSDAEAVHMQRLLDAARAMKAKETRIARKEGREPRLLHVDAPLSCLTAAGRQ